MLELLNSWLLEQGLSEKLAFYVARGVAMAGVLLLSLIANIVAKRYIVSGLTYVITRYKSTWQDAVLRQQTLNRIAHLVPAIILYDLVPVALQGLDPTIAVIKGALLIYMIIVVMLVLDSVLNTAEEIYQNFRAAKQIPIKGFIQVLKLLVYFLAAVFVISVLLNKTPVYLLSGIGALAAVMMLVFRDSILGFVAGIQKTDNKMVAVGDWIDMPK